MAVCRARAADASASSYLRQASLGLRQPDLGPRGLLGTIERGERADRLGVRGDRFGELLLSRLGEAEATAALAAHSWSAALRQISALRE